MAAILIATLLIVAMSAVVGAAVCALCGWRASWLAPAIGFAVVLAVGGAVEHVPGDAGTIAGMLLLLTAASLALRSTRSSLAGGIRDGLPIAVAVALLAVLPFAVTGRAGALGAGGNNDMVQHLTTADWLDTHEGGGTVLISEGYPLGPHGLAAAITKATGMSLVHAFDGLTVAIAVITALAAMSVLAGLPRPSRLVLAPTVALCYLGASYLVQGAFKEPAEALFLLAFVLGLRELVQQRARATWRTGVPLGLLAAAPIYVYSYFGIVWPLAAGGLYLAIELVARRRTLRLRAASAAVLPAALGAAIALGVVCAPQLDRMASFADSELAHHPVQNRGNLMQPIPAVQALGVWLRGDYRFDPDPFAPTVALLVVTGVLAVLAFAWWVRRRDFALPAALAAAGLIYWQATVQKNIYDEAKALAILAPLVALTVGTALAAACAELPRGTQRARSALPRVRAALLRAGAVVVLVATLGSSFLALRDGPVGPDAHASDLAGVRSLVRPAAVLHMDNDDFTHWYLSGVDVATGPLLYERRTVTPTKKRWRPGDPFDFDSWPARTLDLFRYVIEPNSAYRSGTPPNFELVRRTRWFVLWRRAGPTPRRRVLERRASPGATLDCDTRKGRKLARRDGVAAVQPKPVVRSWAAWRGQAQSAGKSASLTLQLPRGRWDVSLQYISSTGMDVRGPGLHATLPAHLGRIGPYWLVGTLRQERSGPATVRVTARRLPLVGRLLGATGFTRAHDVPGNLPLQRIAFTRHASAARVVPLRRACGRYVDWYRLRKAGT